MNFKELQDLVILNTRRKDKLDLIKSAINLALTQISQVHSWNALKASADLPVVLNDSQVTLPQDLDKLTIVKVSDTGSITWPFIIREKTEVITRYPNPQLTAASRPVLGYVERGAINFLPYSNGNYTFNIWYRKSITPLALDADVCDIPGLDNVITAFATAYVFGSIQMPQDDAFWARKYSGALTIAIRHDRDQPATERVQTGFDAQDTTAPLVNPWQDPFVMNNPPSDLI
jgi:hypothetical protein